MTVYDTPPSPGMQRLTYALRRYFGLPDFARHTDEEACALERLSLLPLASRTLTGFLNTPGELRSGPLFGTRNAGVLHISHAATGHPRPRVSGLTIPLDIDPAYVLGFSDAVSVYGSMSVDWLGHWMIAPDNEPGSDEENARWVTHAHHRGLVDVERPLVIVSNDRGLVTVRAFLFDTEDGVVPLATE